MEVTPALRAAVRAARELEEAKKRQAARAEKTSGPELLVRENVASDEFARAEVAVIDSSVDVGRPPGLGQRYELHPHQQEGYDWLVRLHGDEKREETFKGAILADDMGLGKTIQVLSFLSWLLSKHDGGPFLIVGPVALTENWSREAARFFGAAFEPILQVKGSRDIPDEPDRAAKRLAANIVTLVSYETLARNTVAFARVPWKVVVLDEAQKTKNINTRASRSVRALKARFRLVVTGTPVENTLTDLWALSEFALPGLLGGHAQFSKDFVRPVANASSVEERLQVSKKSHAPQERLHSSDEKGSAWRRTSSSVREKSKCAVE